MTDRESDRELLELAAKAAGIPITPHPNYRISRDCQFVSGGRNWNPLTDDGDALRLAVKLGITIDPESSDVIGKSLCRASWNNQSMSLGEFGRGDPLEATRRAIVRAAAEIGRQQ